LSFIFYYLQTCETDWQSDRDDFLTAVRVANDFRTECQRDVEKMNEECARFVLFLYIKLTYFSSSLRNTVSQLNAEIAILQRPKDQTLAILKTQQQQPTSLKVSNTSSGMCVCL
jgi:hypothetical protein